VFVCVYVCVYACVCAANISIFFFAAGRPERGGYEVKRNNGTLRYVPYLTVCEQEEEKMYKDRRVDGAEAG